MARKRQRGKSYTISCTAEQLEAIEAGAIAAGMSVSAWFVKCALTVDPWPKAHRRLVLDGKEQRYILRSAAELAQGLHSKGGMSSQLADDLGVLLKARLVTMVGQGRRDEATALLRTVFGKECAEVVAAAFIPEPPPLPEAPERPEEDETEEGPEEDVTEEDVTEEDVTEEDVTEEDVTEEDVTEEEPEQDVTEEGPEKDVTEQGETEETPRRDRPQQLDLI